MFGKYLKGAQDFLANASAADIVEKAKVAAKDAADAAAKVSETVQAEYRRTFEDLDCQILTVRPEMLAMEFPAQDKIDRLASRLNNDHGDKAMVLNLSGSKYHTPKFNAKVVDVDLNGLPVPPLESLMELCVTAHEWLASDKGNVVVAHGEAQSYSRAVFFLSCFMVFRGLCPQTDDGFQEVCKRMSQNAASAVAPSHRRYLAYFQQCLQGASPQHTRIRLHRAQLGGIPKFEADGAVVFRPYIEIWAGGALVYSSITPPEGDGTSLTPMGYGATDARASFQFPTDLYVSGDVLLRVQHSHSNETSQPAFAVTCHTGLLPDGLQLAKHELDGANSDAKFPEDFILDVLFEEARGGEVEPAAPVYQKARDLARELAAEQKRKEAETAKAVSGVASERDEFAELEATLLRGTGDSPRVDTEPAAAAAAPPKAAAQPPAAAQPAEPAKAEAAASAEAPTEAAAPLAPAKPAAAPAASTEIDDLFNEFDAVLESVDGEMGNAGAGSGDAAGSKAKAASGYPSEEKAKAAPAAPALAPKAAEAAPKAKASEEAKSSPPADETKPAKASDDPFGDVDDFLNELDSIK